MSTSSRDPAPRTRMTAKQRREQLIEVGRTLFAERGFEATSVEEIALHAQVSKPVIYQHFGGKEGLYAVVVDREMATLHSAITDSLGRGGARARLERVALALLTYIEEHTEGFRILVRDSAADSAESSYSTLLNDAISQVAHILGRDFTRRDLDLEYVNLYAQALVGMVAQTAGWWLDERAPDKETVAAHIVNLCWNGLLRMEKDPHLLHIGPAGAEKSVPPVPASAPGAPAS